MKSISNFKVAYGLEVGESSSEAVNHIIFSNGDDEKLIVSEYVCLLFKNKVKLDDISKMVNFAKSNKVVLGYIYELELLLKIKEQHVLKHRDLFTDEEVNLFECQKVLSLNNITKARKSDQYPNTVIIPDKFNQPCFDFLTITQSSSPKLYILTAYQITISNTHKMKLKYMYDAKQSLQSKIQIEFDPKQFYIHIIRPTDLALDETDTEVNFNASFVFPNVLTKSQKQDIQSNMKVYYVDRTQHSE